MAVGTGTLLGRYLTYDAVSRASSTAAGACFTDFTYFCRDGACSLPVYESASRAIQETVGYRRPAPHLQVVSTRTPDIRINSSLVNEQTTFTLPLYRVYYERASSVCMHMPTYAQSTVSGYTWLCASFVFVLCSGCPSFYGFSMRSLIP